ncbi:MAG: D-alanyl-D-alanine carboxypeptidase [Clostridia bacterium]|nr:D-alanyl-D-alanine carboxypeptidase [Clostridia bacterium]
MKRFCCIFLFFTLLYAFTIPCVCAEAPNGAPQTETAFSGNIDAKSAILMEASTGEVLYEKNADQALPPASVTKVMTILLVLEAIDSGKIKLDDMVTVSDYASTMGGSQVYLKAGETMSVSDMLKSVVVASANDAAVALAEHVAGSEASFVAMMNARAAELGMANTTFKNTNGLDDEDVGHLTSARDIALMSREVLKHEKIFDYTTIWMDSIRDGAFGLTNTNRLVRFYRGCNGLKTGSTSKAGFCISATAQRDGMQLICVIMGSSTKDARNALAASLLDFGFANYSFVSIPGGVTDALHVRGGVQDDCHTEYGAFSILLTRGADKNIETEYTLPESLAAPVKKGDLIGTITYRSGDTVLGTVDITAAEDVERISFFTLFLRMLDTMALG